MSETPSKPPVVINFAYGSNMLEARIRERAPSAQSLGVAELPGYRLRWHKVGSDGSGKCDIVKGDEEATVFGVLFSIPAAEKSALDRAEGLGSGYAERKIVVSAQDAPVEASVYYATKTDPSVRPYSWYKALVVAGAKQHALPSHYIATLEVTVVIEDPDRSRHSRNMALANAG